MLWAHGVEVTDMLTFNHLLFGAQKNEAFIVVNVLFLFLFYFFIQDFSM